MGENNCEKILTLLINGTGLISFIALLVFMILKANGALEITLTSLVALGALSFFTLSSIHHFVDNDAIDILSSGSLYLALCLIATNYTFLGDLSLKSLIAFGLIVFISLIGIIFYALDKYYFNVANIILLMLILILMFFLMPLNYFLITLGLGIASLVFYFINYSYMHSLSHLFILFGLLFNYAIIYFNII